MEVEGGSGAGPPAAGPARNYFAVIVGAGLSGAVLAQQLAREGRRVLVLDRRAHVGGNVFDEVEPASGLRVSRYGAHLFHTNDEGVWAYVQRFGAWRRWDHRVVTRVGGALVPVPANINTVNALFGASLASEEDMRRWMAGEREGAEADAANSEEVALARVGRRLYDALFATYTRKQWGVPARELDALVLRRIPVRDSFDDRYFGDKYQALPEAGYTALVANMLASPHIDVRTGADFFAERAALEAAAEWVLYTGPIDAFFPDAGLPRLAYRSIVFESTVVDCAGYMQPNSVVNYADDSTPNTRTIECVPGGVRAARGGAARRAGAPRGARSALTPSARPRPHRYKHFLHQTSPTGKTVLVSEHTTDVGEPYYPMPTRENTETYARYQALAAEAEARTAAPRVRFVGRLATYKYINMDQAIRAALDAAAGVEAASAHLFGAAPAPAADAYAGQSTAPFSVPLHPCAILPGLELIILFFECRLRRPSLAEGLLRAQPWAPGPVRRQCGQTQRRGAAAARQHLHPHGAPPGHRAGTLDGGDPLHVSACPCPSRPPSAASEASA